MAQLKKKHLIDFLQDVDDFQKSNWKLEQYMTQPDIAADMLFLVLQQEQNLQDKICADFGCGTGMLMCGLIRMECKKVIGYEIDKKAIEIANEQIYDKFEDHSLYEIIQTDINNLECEINFDLVIMNPPFGTKQEGIDVIFLKKAMQYCNGNIYSLHKTVTRKYLQKIAEENQYNFTVLQTYQFPLYKQFKEYHKQDVKYTEVDFILFKK